MFMGIFVKVLFVTIIAITTIIVFAWKKISTILPVKVVSYVKIAITIIVFAWREITTILPVKVVFYVKIAGVLLSVILGTLLFLL